jgi:hypothetical protein
MLDATASAEHLVPGSDVELTVRIYNAGGRAVEVRGIGIRLPAGWGPVEATGVGVIAPGEELERTFQVHVPQDAAPTQPYFLRAPRWGDMYDWSSADPNVRGALFDAPLLRADVEITVGAGPVVHASREITYRYRDQAIGEVRRPVTVVPRVGVRLTPTLLVWSTAGPPTADLTVEITHFTADSTTGEVVLEVDGWEPVHREAFALGRLGETRTIVFTVRRPDDVTGGTVAVRASARTADGKVFHQDIRTIDYGHVRPTQWVRPAEGTIRVAPIALPDVATVGYIRGASDRVPEALQAIGVPIALLSGSTLANGDLSRYDVIVVGPRAYETDDALRRHNDRLLDYVRRGGHVVVQYQQRQFSAGDYAPFPLEIARPTARITDETAPVRVLEPDHPILRHPNRIGADDWDGWVQERGLYFAEPWDERYVPLLEMIDPQGTPLRGSLLATRYGNGTYVYAALSFFRTIPAGVTGTYRLFLNLIAWDGADE